MNCKYIKTDGEGNIIFVEETKLADVPVMSDEVIPKGCPRYERAFVIDKCEAAFCDGNDNWYANVNGKMQKASAGQTWAELFK